VDFILPSAICNPQFRWVGGNKLKEQIELTVNGVKWEIVVAPNELLLNVLRERLGLTGAKYGCGIGECGSCTVLVDREPVLACLTLAIGVSGSDIVTIEGVSQSDGSLHPVQESFLEHGAIQCGFCTPGMVLMGKALLDENPRPTEEEIRKFIRGNICRCTGYTQIVKAIKHTSVKGKS
jgi:aerobic-type carbon monoxide dehydrogenase small subunit (CoxS/CutS family)